MEEERQKYVEVAEQIYNLVDNDKDKVNAFLSAKSVPQENEKEELQRWFDNYVKPDELEDLLKDGETKRGFVSWLSDDSNNTYLDVCLKKIDASTPQEESPLLGTEKEYIKKSIEDEDDELYNDPSVKDVSFSSSNVDDQDEIDMAIAALDYSDDIDVTFEIVGDGSEDDDSSEDSSINIEKEITPKKKNHRKKVHLNHTINRIVEKIDDEEVTDRLHHEKYYVAKREQLGGPDNLDRLEDELDKQLISYYDFPHVSIKMYESNEVKMNRIFKKLGFKFRCKDIAKYTRNWHAK